MVASYIHNFMVSPTHFGAANAGFGLLVVECAAWGGAGRGVVQVARLGQRTLEQEPEGEADDSQLSIY